MFGNKKQNWVLGETIPQQMIDGITRDSWLGYPPCPPDPDIKYIGD